MRKLEAALLRGCLDDWTGARQGSEMTGCASVHLMNIAQILNRLTGFSTPIGGLSWQSATLDVEVARGVLIFLEDRRVLYDPFEVQVPEHCVESVLQIRQFLTTVLADQGIGSELAGHLRAMRAACRAFLYRFSSPADISFGDINEDWWLNQELGQALGALRTVFGFQLAQIAARYSLDVDEPLSYTIHSALPPPRDDEE